LKCSTHCVPHILLHSSSSLTSPMTAVLCLQIKMRILITSRQCCYVTRPSLKSWQEFSKWRNSLLICSIKAHSRVKRSLSFVPILNQFYPIHISVH
jgi:hypothetical protein